MKALENFKMHGLAYLSWVEFIIDYKGEVHQVKCMICTSIEGKNKLLAPKVDNLLKHVGCRKCKVSMPGVDARSYYMNKNFVHSNNEMQYTTNQRLVLDLFQCDIPFEHKRKYVQFATLYDILVHGCPMIDFERFKVLFQMLKVKNVGRKHWNDSFARGMVEVMHNVLLNATKATFAFMLMKSQQSIILKGCPSIYMLSKLGRGFQSSSMLKQLGSLPLLTTYFF
jgi:hypothetical protein